MDLYDGDIPPWDDSLESIFQAKKREPQAAAPTTTEPRSKAVTVDFSRGQYQGEILTIYTDASYCHDTRVAGWGAWMRDSNKTYSCGGVFKCKFDSSNKAELYAIIEAIKHAHAIDWLKTASLIVIVTDSQYAKGVIDGTIVRGTETQALLRDIFGLMKVCSCRWKVNWVKGHSNNDGARSWVNQQCDRIARKHMQEARKQYQ